MEKGRLQVVLCCGEWNRQQDLFLPEVISHSPTVLRFLSSFPIIKQVACYHPIPLIFVDYGLIASGEVGSMHVIIDETSLFSVESIGFFFGGFSCMNPPCTSKQPKLPPRQLCFDCENVFSVLVSPLHVLASQHVR